MYKRKFLIKRSFKVFLGFFLIGIVLSIIYYSNMNKSDLNNVLYNIKNNKYLILNNHEDMLFHLKIISIILVFNFIHIGIFFFFGLIITEGYKFMIKTLFFLKVFKNSGLIYYLIYYLITNLIYLVLLYTLLKKVIKISKLFFKKEIKKENINYLDIINLTKHSVYTLLLIVATDFIIFQNYKHIAKLFAFLLK